MPQSITLSWMPLMSQKQLMAAPPARKFSNAPLFMVHDIGLGHGAVGGVIQSGYRHGIESAEILAPGNWFPLTEALVVRLRPYAALNSWMISFRLVIDGVAYLLVSAGSVKT